MTTTSDLQRQGTATPVQRAPRPIDPGVTIGHVHLRTADIDRVRGFYVGVLGFDVVFEARDVPGWGTTGDILFLAAGGYHHHVGANVWESAGGSPPPPGSAALRLATIALPSAGERDEVVGRLSASGQELEEAPEGPIVRDPSGNRLLLAA